MNDKELILKLVSAELAKIGKQVIPSMPIQAMETLVRLGINNQLSKFDSYMGFFFDNEGNLPSPDEFWSVARSVLNDKPIEIPLFGNIIRINGKDVDQVWNNFRDNKNT